MQVGLILASERSHGHIRKCKNNNKKYNGPQIFNVLAPLFLVPALLSCRLSFQDKAITEGQQAQNQALDS